MLILTTYHGDPEKLTGSFLVASKRDAHDLIAKIKGDGDAPKFCRPLDTETDAEIAACVLEADYHRGTNRAPLLFLTRGQRKASRERDHARRNLRGIGRTLRREVWRSEGGRVGYSIRKAGAR